MAVNPIDAPAIALDGEFLLALFLGALALLLFATYAIANRIWIGMRPSVAGIALVGGALAGAGDHVVGALRSAALALNQATLWAINTSLQTLHTLGSWITATLVNPLVYAYNGTVARVESVWNQAYNALPGAISSLQYWQSQLWLHVWNLETGGANLFNYVHNVVDAKIGQLFDRTNSLQANADALNNYVRNVLAPDLAALERDLAPVRAVAVPLGLIGHWPLDIPARLGAAEAGLEGVRGRVGTLEGKVAILLPLSVIAAAGSTAISDLARIGSNPCEIVILCDLLSDLPDRVEALENFGT